MPTAHDPRHSGYVEFTMNIMNLLNAHGFHVSDTIEAIECVHRLCAAQSQQEAVHSVNLLNADKTIKLN